MPRLRGFGPITEDTKAKWIQWLGTTLDYVQTQAQEACDDDDTNRIFGEDQDDVVEVEKLLASMFLTLTQFTLVPNQPQ